MKITNIEETNTGHINEPDNVMVIINDHYRATVEFDAMTSTEDKMKATKLIKLERMSPDEYSPSTPIENGSLEWRVVENFLLRNGVDVPDMIMGDMPGDVESMSEEKLALMDEIDLAPRN